MTLDRTQILMYTSVVPYTIASLMGVACAPKTIVPTTPTLTERTQKIQGDDFARELGFLVSRVHSHWRPFIQPNSKESNEISYGPLTLRREIAEETFRNFQITDIVGLKSLGSTVSDTWVMRVDNHDLTYLTLRRYTNGLCDWYVDFNNDGKFDRAVIDRPIELHGFNQLDLVDRDDMTPEDVRIGQERFEDGIRKVIAAIIEYSRSAPHPNE